MTIISWLQELDQAAGCPGGMMAFLEAVARAASHLLCNTPASVKPRHAACESLHARSAQELLRHRSMHAEQVEQHFANQVCLALVINVCVLLCTYQASCRLRTQTH